MRGRQSLVIGFSVLLVVGTLLFPPDASWWHVYRFASGWDGTIASDRLLQLLLVDLLLIIGLILSLGTRWRLNAGQHLTLWAAIGFIIWISLAPYSYAMLYYGLYRGNSGGWEVDLPAFLIYCLVMAGMAGILIGALELARHMKDPPGDRLPKWSARQRRIRIIGITLIGLTGFFPRDDYDYVYILFTQRAPYYFHDLYLIWITAGVTLAVLLWSLDEGNPRLSLPQRAAVLLGLVAGMLQVLFPPTIYWYWHNSAFIFERNRELVDTDRLLQLEITIALVVLLILRLLDRKRPLHTSGIVIHSLGIGLLILNTHPISYGNPISSLFYEFREHAVHVHLFPVFFFWLVIIILIALPFWRKTSPTRVGQGAAEQHTLK